MDDIEEKRKQSLKYSIWSGAFYSAMYGFGESFFSAFAVFLQSTNIQLGLLGSLPRVVGYLSQLFSNRLINLFKSRKRLVCGGVFLQALTHIPILLTFFMGYAKVYYLLLFISLYWIFGSVITPAWSSWMGDLVKENQRGVYFGKRNKISGITSMAVYLAAGLILYFFNTGLGKQYLGFVAIFSLALVARLFSFMFLSKKYDPGYKLLPENHFSFMSFVKEARFNNFGRFVIFLALMNFSIYLASPFFAAYMLYDVKLNYLAYAIVNGTMLMVKYITMPLWGRLSDKYGTKKVLGLSSFLMSICPLLWVLNQEIWYLILIQAYAGLMFAGFEIAYFNYFFDSTTPQKRPICVAYSNVLSGIAIFLGGIGGGLIAKYNYVLWSKYYLVFIVSFALRFLTAIFFIPMVKEFRKVEEISYKKLFVSVITAARATGFVYNLYMTQKSYISKRFRKDSKKP
jgi:MFS family permease